MFLAVEKSGVEESFKTRDDLFYFLDIENAKCRQFDQKKMFTLQQLNTSDRVVDLSNIRLPYDASLDKLLKDFGKKNEAKAEVLLEAIPGVTKEELSKVSKKESPKTTISTSKPVKQSPKGLLILGLVQLILLGAVFGVCFMTNQRLKTELMTTQADLKELTVTMQETHSADVFARYFLPNYYSGEQANLEAYLDKGNKVDVQTGQVLSVILEQVKNSENSLDVTYVLLLKTEVGQENIRLTIPLKKDGKAKYGYLVADQLIKEAFPK